MDETKTLRVGDIAPDFVLKDHHDRDFHMEEITKRRILLSFHPLAWTPVCAEQMKSLEAHASAFEELQTAAFGLSVDPFPSKRAWAKELGIKKLRLLCDFWPHGAVSHAFGLFREEDGFSERANLLIDEGGKVAFIKIYDISELPDIEELLAFLKK